MIPSHQFQHHHLSLLWSREVLCNGKKAEGRRRNDGVSLWWIVGIIKPINRKVFVCLYFVVENQRGKYWRVWKLFKLRRFWVPRVRIKLPFTFSKPGKINVKKQKNLVKSQMKNDFRILRSSSRSYTIPPDLDSAPDLARNTPAKS